MKTITIATAKNKTRRKCPACGMAKSHWQADRGKGVVVRGRFYCCYGCADQFGCRCHAA